MGSRPIGQHGQSYWDRNWKEAGVSAADQQMQEWQELRLWSRQWAAVKPQEGLWSLLQMQWEAKEGF